MTNPPCRWARGSQRVKKALQRLPPLGGEENEIIFCRGVYLKRDLSRILSMKLRSRRQDDCVSKQFVNDKDS